MKFPWPESKFNTEEFACKCGCGFGSRPEDVLPDLIFRLQVMRYLYNNPMVVMSGARCGPHNAAVGGEVNSAHLPHPATRQCRAVDIYVPDSASRFKLFQLAHQMGFQRMGDDQLFMHLDRAWDLPSPAHWVYR